MYSAQRAESATADCPSGQWERTVNPSAKAYVGSNPTSATECPRRSWIGGGISFPRPRHEDSQRPRTRSAPQRGRIGRVRRRHERLLPVAQMGFQIHCDTVEFDHEPVTVRGREQIGAKRRARRRPPRARAAIARPPGPVPDAGGPAPETPGPRWSDAAAARHRTRRSGSVNRLADLISQPPPSRRAGLGSRRDRGATPRARPADDHRGPRPAAGSRRASDRSWSGPPESPPGTARAGASLVGECNFALVAK